MSGIAVPTPSSARKQLLQRGFVLTGVKEEQEQAETTIALTGLRTISEEPPLLTHTDESSVGEDDDEEEKEKPLLTGVLYHKKDKQQQQQHSPLKDWLVKTPEDLMTDGTWLTTAPSLTGVVGSDAQEQLLWDGSPAILVNVTVTPDGDDIIDGEEVNFLWDGTPEPLNGNYGGDYAMGATEGFGAQYPWFQTVIRKQDVWPEDRDDDTLMTTTTTPLQDWLSSRTADDPYEDQSSSAQWSALTGVRKASQDESTLIDRCSLQKHDELEDNRSIATSESSQVSSPYIQEEPGMVYTGEYPQKSQVTHDIALDKFAAPWAAIPHVAEKEE